jgi:hypothetical protein
MAELELVIDEVDSGAGEERLQHGVDVVRHLLHLRDVGGARPAEHADVILVAQGIVQARRFSGKTRRWARAA